MKTELDFKREELENILNSINVPDEYIQYMAQLISERMEKIDENLDDDSFEEDLAEKMRERFPGISDYYIENAIKYIGISSMLFELNEMLNSDDKGEE